MTQTLRWRVVGDEIGEEDIGWVMESLIYCNKELGLYPMGF